MSHLEERMETDLNYIRSWLWKIGDDVEAALRNAKKALILGDSKLAYEVVLGDHPINRDSRQCDRLCHTFIARYLPGAGALREMASTIRVNVILERIGDYAVTICREGLQLDNPCRKNSATGSTALPMTRSTSCPGPARLSGRAMLNGPSP
jgi:phosphate transport system protein